MSADNGEETEEELSEANGNVREQSRNRKVYWKHLHMAESAGKSWVGGKSTGTRPRLTWDK